VAGSSRSSCPGRHSESGKLPWEREVCPVGQARSAVGVHVYLRDSPRPPFAASVPCCTNRVGCVLPAALAPGLDSQGAGEK
jgi:hypothetical protein